MTFEEIDRLVERAKTKGPIIPHNNPERSNYYKFFYLLAKDMNADICCEIGIEGGAGSRHFAASGSKVIAVDLNFTIKEKNVVSIKGDSCSDEVYKKVVKESNKEIDILFQDSSHHYKPSKKEWELYSPLMKEGGVWICDDITPAFHDSAIDPPGKGMVQYFEEIPMERKKLYPDVLHRGNTQGIILF